MIFSPLSTCIPVSDRLHLTSLVLTAGHQVGTWWILFGMVGVAVPTHGVMPVWAFPFFSLTVLLGQKGLHLLTHNKLKRLMKQAREKANPSPPRDSSPPRRARDDATSDEDDDDRYGDGDGGGNGSGNGDGGGGGAAAILAVAIVG